MRRAECFEIISIRLFKPVCPMAIVHTIQSCCSFTLFAANKTALVQRAPRKKPSVQVWSQKSTSARTGTAGSAAGPARRRRSRFPPSFPNDVTEAATSPQADGDPWRKRRRHGGLRRAKKPPLEPLFSSKIPPASGMLKPFSLVR
jgi:hypothetical protein